MRSVLILKKDNKLEAFTTLTKLCRSNPTLFNYGYLKGKKDFPYTYKGHEIFKMELK
ncbi:MAG: hypothetical protein Tsb0033_27840 [Winogradskyella sp.]